MTENLFQGENKIQLEENKYPEENNSMDIWYLPWAGCSFAT